MKELIAGTDFWRNSQWICEGSKFPLCKEEALTAGHIVSKFAESVDGCETSMDSRTSLGQILRQNLQQVSFHLG